MLQKSSGVKRRNNSFSVILSQVHRQALLNQYLEYCNTAGQFSLISVSDKKEMQQGSLVAYFDDEMSPTKELNVLTDSTQGIGL